MFQKSRSVWAMLLLGGALVLGTAESVQARGGGGGGHGGGGHGGGGHWGGGHVAYGGAGHVGGYRGGYGYGRSYSYGSAYPYYSGDYTLGDYSYSSYPDYSAYSYPDNEAYSGGSQQVYSAPANVVADDGAVPPAASASIIVRLPGDAQLWFNGVKMKTTGSSRTFESPPLSPGQRYTYDVRASWKESGKEVTQKQQILVNAGSESTLIFANAPATK